MLHSITDLPLFMPTIGRGRVNIADGKGASINKHKHM